MYLEQCRQAKLQIHLGDQQFHSLLRCILYLTVLSGSHWRAVLIFIRVSRQILRISSPGLGSSKVLVIGTWYLMQIIEYLVLTCTWPYEIQKYLVLTCTWRPKYLILVQVLKYFCQINKYSVLNLWICSLQQFTTEHHNQNYWNGSYWVCWQHGSQDVKRLKTGLSPWFTGQALRPDDSIWWQNSGHHWFR